MHRYTHDDRRVSQVVLSSTIERDGAHVRLMAGPAEFNTKGDDDDDLG